MAVKHGLFVAGAPTGSSPIDGRLAIAGMLSASAAGPIDAAGGIMYGPGSPLLVTGSSSGPNMKYNIAAGNPVTARGTASDGLVIWSNVGTLLVDSGAPSPNSGTRWDLIYAVAHDANDHGDPDSDPVLGVLVGVAGSPPSKPYTAGSGVGGTSLPAGALVLAESLVGTNIANASTATITMVAPLKSTRGTPVVCRNKTERDALLKYDGLMAYRLDTNHVYQCDGSAWHNLSTVGSLLAEAASTGSDDNNLGTLNTQRLMPACRIVHTFDDACRVRVVARGRMWGQGSATAFNAQASIGYYSGSTVPTDGTAGGNISPAITEINPVARPVFRNANITNLEYSNFTLDGTVSVAAGTWTFLVWGLHSAGGVVSGPNQDLIGRGYIGLYDAGWV